MAKNNEEKQKKQREDDKRKQDDEKEDREWKIENNVKDENEEDLERSNISGTVLYE